ncbi:MAG: PorV/PorQ family protein [Candidatus Zixiibacteriota bacterium]
MKKVFFLSILTAILMFVAADSVLAVSNAAVLYLRVAAGARPGGMGEAFVSIADDATATYWNPAGLGNSPIAGKMETRKIPEKYGEATDVVTIERNKTAESWFIADGQLIMFNGKSWSSGTNYPTRADQSLPDFINTVISYESDEQVKTVAANIVRANCDVNPDNLNRFVQTIRENIPENYKEADFLRRGLDSLEASYKLCLVNANQFNDLYRKFQDGFKDSVLIAAELDRITFSIESAMMRFLPSDLMVPFSAMIDGELRCLGKTKDYLWVATDKGLYRLSGTVWAHFSVDDNLPSSDILSLAYFDEHLWIGTAAGLAKYYQGSFETVAVLPAEPVTAIALRNATYGAAVVGGRVYYFDGMEWNGTYNYTVRLDDTIENIARRIAIYGTPKEIEFLMNEIKQLNAPVVEADEPVEGELVVDTLMGETGETVAAETAEGASEEMMTEAGEVSRDAAEGTEEMSGESMPVDNDWFTEGAIIKLPYCAPLKYDATAMMVDLQNRIWVGTSSGLLSFDGRTWTNHGYTKFVVPETDEDAAQSMTAKDIARRYLPKASEANVEILANNIIEYNDLSDGPIMPGTTVYVYHWNIGSKTYSIGMSGGEIYVGTEYGLEQLAGSGWESVDFQHLDERIVLDVYDFEGEAYYVAADGITYETRGMREFVFMHVNWLPSLNLDIYYDFASYVHNVRGLGTFGVSIIYLNYGKIIRTDAEGHELGELNPYEIALAVSFGTSLTSNLKGGITGRFIHSRLSPQGAGQEQGEGIASTGAVDLGLLYKMGRRMQIGLAVTNLGWDITYIDADQSDALPRNLGFGVSYKVWDSPYNSLVVQGEINKLLVNMNKGFGTELEYAIRHIGAEYWYANFIALRAGYKYDKEGEVKHLTFGAGLKIDMFRLDFAYVPSSVDSPLANTLRISFTGTF